MLYWFLLFMMSYGSVVPIGGLHCGRMMIFNYLKDGGSTKQNIVFVGFLEDLKKTKYPMIELCL